MPSSLQRLFRRLRHGEPVIVVSGLPRSGTSMASRMLEAGGVSIVQDGIRAPDEDNPRGYFEDERVKALAKTPDKSWVRAARGRSLKVISYLLASLPDDNDYRVLFMSRDLREVVASQNKMLVRRGEKNETADDKMIELFEGHLKKVRQLLDGDPRFEWIELHHRQVVDDPMAAAVRIQEFVGRPLDLAKMAAAVERDLHRNRR